jgi:putative sigma-54 modulation protein
MATMNLQARSCEVDEELEAHFSDKLEHLKRLWPALDDAQVRVRHERGRYSAEVTLLSGGIVTRGEERAATLRQAFDCAIEKIEAQMRRHKERIKSRARRHDNRDDAAGTVSHVKMPPIETSLLHDDGSEYSPAEGDAVNDGVVRVKRFALKPMSPEEASLQMGLLGHSFFVFRDAENDQVSVVYRREGGGYGLIEPVAD